MLYFLGDINVWPNNDHTLDFNNWIAEDPFLRTIPKEHKFVVLFGIGLHCKSQGSWKS